MDNILFLKYSNPVFEYLQLKTSFIQAENARSRIMLNIETKNSNKVTKENKFKKKAARIKSCFAHPLLGREGRESNGKRGKERVSKDFWEPSAGADSDGSLGGTGQK